MSSRIRWLLIPVLAAMLWAGSAWAGTVTASGFLYKPALGASGTTEKNLFDAGFDRVDDRLGNEIWVGDPNYGTTLSAAITAIGSNTAILRVPPGTVSIAADLTIPANITLKPERGAIFAIATGKTLTINGGFVDELCRYFSCTGTGKVVFGTGSIQEVPPQWWYDGGGDWSAAFQSAADSVAQVGRASDGGDNRNTGGVIRLVAGAYTLNSTVTVYEAMSVLGAGQESTHLTYTGTGPAFDFTSHGNWNTRGPRFKGFTLFCSGASACGLRIGDPKTDILNTVHDNTALHPKVEDVFFRGDYTNPFAIQWNVAFGGEIKGCSFTRFIRQIDFHGSDENIIEGNRFSEGEVQVAIDAGFPIEGMTAGNPTVVTWTGHGLTTGKKVALFAMKQANWVNYNGYGYYAVTKIDDDHFSLAFDSTTWGAYNASTDPGLISYEYWSGSRNRIINNSFLVPTNGALAFILSGDAQPWICHNFFENYLSYGTTNYIVKFLPRTGNITLNNNSLEIGTGATTLGSFDFGGINFWNGTGGISSLTCIGNGPMNNSAYTQLAANFGLANRNWRWFHKFSGYRCKVVHYGNAQPIDDSFPFNSQERQTWPGNTAFVGGLDYPGLTSETTSGKVWVSEVGAWNFNYPSATKADTLLSWLHTGVNGTVSIMIEAKAGVTSQQVKVERLNGEVTGATATQALTTSWAWYKVFTGAAVTDLGINLWNDDTTHNGAVYLRRVVVMYENSTLYCLGTWQYPFWMGSYSLWVNASSGKLYKKNGTPANDTDGTIVGSE